MLLIVHRTNTYNIDRELKKNDQGHAERRLPVTGARGKDTRDENLAQDNVYTQATPCSFSSRLL